MHLTHINLKPTRKIDFEFKMSDVMKEIEIPEESKVFAKEYVSSKKLLDDYEDKDVFLTFEDKMIYAFDYFHKKEKILIPEINPVTIFYSNAIMSHRKLLEYREELLIKSPRVKNLTGNVNPNHFGDFFRLASNSIINLQATLESFANRIIPNDYLYIDKFGNPTEKTITYKLYNAIPKIKKLDFSDNRSRTKYNKSIDSIIKLRNDLIHLKPAEKDSNYRKIYRDLLSFDYSNGLIAVRTFVNFYETRLIEECQCGKEYYYNTYSVTKSK